MSFVAINWKMYELTNSTAMVGYIALAEFFPMFILAFVGGAIADSFDKRKIGLTDCARLQKSNIDGYSANFSSENSASVGGKSSGLTKNSCSIPR